MRGNFRMSHDLCVTNTHPLQTRRNGSAHPLNQISQRYTDQFSHFLRLGTRCPAGTHPGNICGF